MSLADAFFVDSGVSFRNDVAFSELTSLWHLEGCEVAILADGVVLDNMTVVNGMLSLPVKANTVHVGLPYNCDVQTLPTILERAMALGQASQMNVNKVVIRTHQSSSLFAGPTFDALTEYKAGCPAATYDGQMEIMIKPSWGYDGAVCIRQSQPLPFTLLSLSLDVAKGG